MATELGSAYISVGLGTNSLAGDIKKAFGGAESSGKAAGAGAGRGFLSGFKGLVGAGAALVATGAFAGFIKEAAVASDATDKFKATMSFAGLNTKAIDAAKDAAKAYADQTVYDLPTIQNMMAQLASNGVKDYTGLSKAAGNLNAVAGGNADTFKSVAMVMTQTAGAGKLTTENWNQLADAIPGAAGPLMKSLEKAGAYTGNFRDAMAAGEITSEEFNASLMKLGNDPVAVEAAKSTATFEGAIGNLEATINSGLMTALDALKPAITGAISGLASGIGKVNGIIGGIFTGMKSLIMNGDITPALLKSLGVEEDSPIIGGLLYLQDKFWVVFRGIKDFVTGFKIPTILGPENMGLNKFADAGAKVHGVLVDIKGGFQAAVEAFKAGGNDITSSGIAGFLEGLGLQARKAFDAIGPVFSTIGAAFAPMLPMFAALVPQVFALFQALSPTSLLFQALVPVLPQIAAAIGSVLQAVLPLALSLGSQLLPIITQLITAVLPPLISIFTNIVTAIAPLITQIAGVLIPVIQALMPVVVTVFGVIANVITSAMQIVQGIIQVVTGLITGNWSQVWSGIVNILEGSIGLVVNVITGLKDVILGALSGAGQWLVGVGGQIIQGLLDGLGNAGAAIGSFFLGLLPGWIVEPFKLALGIHSPSRVFAGFGENIGEGLLEGVDGMQGKIDGTMSGLVTVPPVPHFGAPSFSPVRAGGAAPGGPVVQNIHPAPGMSEVTIGRVAADSLNYLVRKAS